MESDAPFLERRARIVALAGRYAIPAIYEFREFCVAGGLISYGIGGDPPREHAATSVSS